MQSHLVHLLNVEMHVELNVLHGYATITNIFNCKSLPTLREGLRTRQIPWARAANAWKIPWGKGSKPRQIPSPVPLGGGKGFN